MILELTFIYSYHSFACFLLTHPLDKIQEVSVHRKKKNSMVWVREQTIPTERPPLVGEAFANFFADRGCHVVSMMDPYSHILVFLDRSRYFSIK
jgi:hypothetical protein